MAEYKLYLDEAGITARKPEENKELELEIVDNGTMERLRVRAILASSPLKLPQVDRVWLYPKGAMKPLQEDPWSIQILETFEDEVIETSAGRRQEVSLGRMRGGMLEALIRQRQEKEGKEEGEGSQ